MQEPDDDKESEKEEGKGDEEAKGEDGGDSALDENEE